LLGQPRNIIISNQPVKPQKEKATFPNKLSVVLRLKSTGRLFRIGLFHISSLCSWHFY